MRCDDIIQVHSVLAADGEAPWCALRTIVQRPSPAVKRLTGRHEGRTTAG